MAPGLPGLLWACYRLPFARVLSSLFLQNWDNFSLLPQHGEKVSQKPFHAHGASGVDVTGEAETPCQKGCFFFFSFLTVFWVSVCFGSP